jgi:hypothetical protein
VRTQYGTEGKYKDCPQITFPGMLNIQEFKTQSKVKQVPDQENEAPHEYTQ